MTTLPKCLVNGKHTPGSEWERVCPLNPNRAADRQAERERKAALLSPAQRAARAAFAAAGAVRLRQGDSSVAGRLTPSPGPSGAPGQRSATTPTV